VENWFGEGMGFNIKLHRCIRYVLKIVSVAAYILFEHAWDGLYD